MNYFNRRLVCTTIAAVALLLAGARLPHAVADCPLTLGACPPPTPAGPNTISAWPGSDARLDWTTLSQFAPTWDDINPDFLVYEPPIVSSLTTDRVNPTPSPNAVCNYAIVAAQLYAANPDVLLGTYISGGDVRAAALTSAWPPDYLAAEYVPAAYLAGPPSPGSDGTLRFSIDLNLSAARSWFSGYILNEVTNRLSCLPRPGLAFVFLDNIRHPTNNFRISTTHTCSSEACLAEPPPPGCGCATVPWTATTNFMGMLRAGVHQRGLKLVANIGSPWAWSDADIAALTASVDGMCFEQPFHKYMCRTSLFNVQREIEIHRGWLAAGKLILFVPVQCESEPGCLECPTGDCPDCSDAVGNIWEQRLMAAMALIIREPGQAIYVNRDFVRPRPDWWNWTERLGPPIDAHEAISGALAGEPVVLTRTFERGRVTANLNSSICQWTAPQAVNIEFFPWFSSQPTDQTVCRSQPASFRATVTGDQPITLQWYHNGRPITGATGPTYDIVAAGPSSAGSYQLIARNASTTTASRVATLTVAPDAGDFNGDGLVNNFDIDPFVDALLGVGTPPSPCTADVNGDGAFNNFDINAIVDLLLGL